MKVFTIFGAGPKYSGLLLACSGAEERGGDLVEVVHDEAEERHEDEDLDDHQKVVLVGHAPDHSPLLLAHSRYF